MTSEFHRPISLDRIGPNGLQVVVEARPEERQALANRLRIPSVLSVRCAFELTRGLVGSIEARARLQARIVQICVVSLDEFEAEIDEPFSLRFVPAGTESDDPDPESDDEVPYAGHVLDLGETAAEQLALSLDPYPRRTDAELPAQEDETTEHPFAALGALRWIQ
jgi:uncharacterized metal-binding protein YceD (DUF177 family)